MKLWSYSVPCTQPILSFIAHCKEVEGSLTGGFQSAVDDLLMRVHQGRIWIDDTVMGRLYRYSRCAVASGGWQDTHLPPFLAEVERLYKAKLHKRERPFSTELFDEFGDE